MFYINCITSILATLLRPYCYPSACAKCEDIRILNLFSLRYAAPIAMLPQGLRKMRKLKNF
jgi:hypothetical protein